ncbi:MCP four helix bundle domain-containing protein [Pontibacter ruber]|uniref:MCP four helix bundle domain-containing protein n=1 Tax=Pontibacter ruber TaxID=1343895 RepID=A0ABW5CTG0_9BACT|nr:MCP four helix bundle domain-containing protein [Pontibacter ruber]
MNWVFRIRQREKLALALGSVFVIIILANWFVSYSIGEVNKQFRSVYQDRLVPSLDISQMLERYYQNRMYLEEHVLTGSIAEKDSIRQLLSSNTRAIDSLVQKFESTYLIEQESTDLANYKVQFAALVRIQEQVMQLSRAGNHPAALQLSHTKGHAAFQNLLVPLHNLIEVQGEVGQELYESAERNVKTLKILSYLVIGLAVLLALIVGTLLQGSRKLKEIKPQNYHMN